MDSSHPVVRHLIVCDDIQFDPNNLQRATLVNMLHAIHSVDQPPFPLLYRELGVMVQVTECRGAGEFWIEIVQADTGRVVRRTRTFEIMQYVLPAPSASCGWLSRLRG